MKKNLHFIAVAIFIHAIPVVIFSQAPANDNCPNAIDIPLGCGGNTSASTINATPNAMPFAFPPSCTATDADDDIWYRFNATSSTLSVSINNAVLQSSGVADIGMEVIAGPCADPSSIFCDNDVVSGTGVVTVSGLSAGSNYLVRFWTTGTASQATFDFCWQDLTVVPVKISAYNATCANGHATVNWTTAQETDVQSFLVEKSSDGKTFEQIATVLPAGSSNGQAYAVVDQQASNGKAFYRLKQTDKNGGRNYFPILTVTCNVTTAAVYPNPVRDLLVIHFDKSFIISQLKIFDIAGAMVNKLDLKPVQPGLITINSSSLKAGVYLVYASDEKGNMVTKKFIKN